MLLRIEFPGDNCLFVKEANSQSSERHKERSPGESSPQGTRAVSVSSEGSLDSPGYLHLGVSLGLFLKAGSRKEGCFQVLQKLALHVMS